ncbi:RtcB family protein [Aquabacterium sp.]|uniref:RtcB family protein n=1 Tax=Aquabacterium sp. TaxID=1872578 RepID=UPI003783C416
MDTRKLLERSDSLWELPSRGDMRVPVRLHASRALLQQMDGKALEQAIRVARLPGVVEAVHVMPDGQAGYGFPNGSVAAFDPQRGVVAVGGLGTDLSAGMRCLHTGLRRADILPRQGPLADALQAQLPVETGGPVVIELSRGQLHDMLSGGAQWAVEHDWGDRSDLDRIEDHGRVPMALPAVVSDRLRQRLRTERVAPDGTDHLLEVQAVSAVCEPAIARAFGLAEGDIVVTLHGGSRGLAALIDADYRQEMVEAAPARGRQPKDPELACAPIGSELGQQYLGAMRAAMNCALANRQILTHRVRQVFRRLFPKAALPLLYDVSHNSCKLEKHRVGGQLRTLHVHRSGAARALGPGHPDLPQALRHAGQPVLVGGPVGAASYLLAGVQAGVPGAFGSACCGSSRAIGRHPAASPWQGRHIADALAARGVLVRCATDRGLADEAPDEGRGLEALVDAAAAAGLARKVARLDPLICIRG